MPSSVTADRPLLRVLIIGASGVFGSRLAERLSLEPGIALTLAGRTLAPLQALATRLGGGAVRSMDRNSLSSRDLAGYDLVIDAAGPFQGSETCLVEACLVAGVDYLDLADGRDWVVRFSDRFNELAKAAGVSLMTGASSIPALSHAVLDEMVADLTQLDSIRIGIFPGNRAPRGLSVVEAILSYAGKPVRTWKDGRWQNRWGWGDSRRVGTGQAGDRWASNCDTPEQDLLVSRYHPNRDALFQAGMELSVLHLGLLLLSLPVRAGLIQSLKPFAKPLLRIAQWLIPFGSDKGAMTVEVVGVDGSGAIARRSWRLQADANRGPFVPVLAAIAMVRRQRDGMRPPPGAGPCSGVLSMADFERDLVALGLTTNHNR